MVMQMSHLIDVYADKAGLKHSKETVATRIRVLRHAAKHLPNGLSTANGDELTTYLAGKKAGWTRSTCYYALRSYYSTLVKHGRIDYNPMEAVERPRSGDSLPNPITDDELAHIIAHSPSQPWRGAAILGAYAGLRCSELCNLEGRHVTRETVHVIDGKGGKGRFVPTHPLVWELREEMGDGHLVLDKKGLPTTMPRMSGTQARHWRAIGLGKDMHLHRLRHWFGTVLVEQGIGIEVVSQLMGHASIATTMGYVKVAAARKTVAINVLQTFARHEPAVTRLVPTTEAA